MQNLFQVKGQRQYQGFEDRDTERHEHIRTDLAACKRNLYGPNGTQSLKPLSYVPFTNHVHVLVYLHGPINPPEMQDWLSIVDHPILAKEMLEAANFRCILCKKIHSAQFNRCVSENPFFSRNQILQLSLENQMMSIGRIKWLSHHREVQDRM